MRYFITLLFCAACYLHGYAQLILFSNDTLNRSRFRIDSLYSRYKHQGYAADYVVGINLGVWMFDRFVTQAEFAHISPATVKANLRKGFVWDNDLFNTNLFMHPYHGGLYFNAARMYGMDFWQSLPYSFGGSLMWEVFMEKEFPSMNDFIATSIGGAGIGEMTFRLSDKVIDERTSGWERFGRETAVTLISPVRGIGRLISGKAWKRGKTKGNVLPGRPINWYAMAGYRNLYDDGEEHNDKSSMNVLTVGLSYGNPYDENNYEPYDYFMVQASANLFSNQPLIGRVTSMGMLYSRPIELKNATRQLSWGLFQHFNYFDSKSDSSNVTLYPYKLSEAASIGPGLLYKKTYRKNSVFCAAAYVSGILLGSSQSDHYYVRNRDYNLGSGFSSKLHLEWMFHERLTLRFRSEDYRIYTWMGIDPSNNRRSAQGDESCASLSVGTLNLEYLFNRHLFAGIESGYYLRTTRYNEFPTVEHGVIDNRINLGWLF